MSALAFRTFTRLAICILGSFRYINARSIFHTRISFQRIYRPIAPIAPEMMEIAIFHAGTFKLPA